MQVAVAAGETHGPLEAQLAAWIAAHSSNVAPCSAMKAGLASECSVTHSHRRSHHCFDQSSQKFCVGDPHPTHRKMSARQVARDMAPAQSPFHRDATVFQFGPVAGFHWS
jgi:hypothetical protein